MQHHHCRQFSNGAPVCYPSPTPPTYESARSKCVSSNTILIDWDKNVVDFVYSCLHPEPRKLTLYEQPSFPPFRKSHRRIVSATTHRGGFGFEPPPSDLRPLPRLTRLAKVRGHQRNVSDPGRQLYQRPPPPPLIAPPATIPSPLEPLRTTGISATDNSNAIYARKDVTGALPPPKLPTPIAESPCVESPCDSSLDSGSHGDSITLEPCVDIEDEDEDEVSMACLVPCMQPLANAKLLLTALCAMIFVQNLVASGYLASILTTLERRFDLTSRQVGYLYASYEITGVISTVGFSLLSRGPNQNRPRMIGIAGLVLGLGFCLFALPHWLSGAYLPGHNVGANSTGIALCDTWNSSSSATYASPLPMGVEQCSAAEATLQIGQKRLLTSDYTVALPLFCFAMGLAGIGSSPLFVLAPTYFWDNLPGHQYPIYSGLLYSAAALGPACGFMSGAAFLQVYVDTPLTPPFTPLSSTSTTVIMDIYSQSWLGAWWMGMVVFGALACLTSIPVISFPRRLPSDDYQERKRKSSPLSPSSETTLAFTPKSSCEDKQTPIGDCGEQHLICFPVDSIPELNLSVQPSANDRKDPPRHDEEFLPQEDCKLHRRVSSLSFKGASTNQNSSVVAEKGGIIRKKRFFSYFKEPKEVDDKIGETRFSLEKTYGRTCEMISDLCLILWRVMANPIWLGVTATTVFEQTIVSAFLTYAAKYFQAQFRVPAHLASIHTGAVVVPSAVLGVLTGAMMMRQFRPTIPQALFSACGSIVATMATTLVLMLGLSCATNQMAGVTAAYDGTPWQTERLIQGIRPANLTAACNAGCQVAMATATGDVELSGSDLRFSCPLASDYNPVCWRQQEWTNPNKEDKRQMSFFNPCLAGCSGYKSYRDEKTGRVIESFTDCNCVGNSTLSPDGSGKGSVSKGVCRPECPQYAAFLIVTFLHIFLTSLNQNPSNVITLSCVSSEDGTVALGLQVFFTRTLAYIPAPIYFGMLMDSVCQLRANPVRNTCIDVKGDELIQLTSLVNVEGACLEYNIQALPYVWLGGVLVFKCFSIVSIFLTWRASIRLEREKKAKSVEPPQTDLDAAVGGTIISA